MPNAIITGCGAYLPPKIVTNKDLEEKVETSDEWIRERTGIEKRHVVESENTSDLAFEAAKDALTNANITAEQVDLIILATTTPDLTFPSTATKLQAMLGMKQGAAFDIQAVCSGFIYALSVANNFISSGQYNTILVVGAETLSRIVDWTDRGTCVLFGDGAGAVVLQANDEPNKGVLSTHLYSDGNYQDILKTTGGTSTGTTGLICMSGQDVFKHAVSKMSASITEGLETNNLTSDDLDWCIPHQANDRILQAVANKLKLPKEKLISTVAEHANTSAASIPLALCQTLKEGKIKTGDVIALTAIGGGLCWGSCIIRW